MGSIIAILDWHGVWKIEENDVPSNIPDEEGIYMVLCGSRSRNTDKWDPSTYELLYIGEAEKVRSRIVGHKKWPEWKENCTNNLLLKVAKCELGTVKRQKVECCLIYKTKPICNDECKKDFPYKDDKISITNNEMILPLEENCSCQVNPVTLPITVRLGAKMAQVWHKCDNHKHGMEETDVNNDAAVIVFVNPTDQQPAARLAFRFHKIVNN